MRFRSCVISTLTSNVEKRIRYENIVSKNYFSHCQSNEWRKNTKHKHFKHKTKASDGGNYSYYSTEVESKTSRSKPRSQKKTETKAKNSKKNPRPNTEFSKTDSLKTKDRNGQGKRPRTQIFSIMVKNYSIIFKRENG